MWCFQWNDSHWSSVTQISEQDRGLAYGDGLFETFRVDPSGKIPLLNYHIQRLQLGLERLLFDEVATKQAMAAIDAIEHILEAKDWQHLLPASDVQKQPKPIANNIPLVGKLTVTRGVGPRGYDIPAQTAVTIILQLSAAPVWQSWLRVPTKEQPQRLGINLKCADIRLSRQPYLAGLKHCNRLEQVLARYQRGDADDVILLDTENNVIEAGVANIALKKNGQWFTPELSQCGVAGVVRQWLINSGHLMEANIPYQNLASYEAVMICNSVVGILAVQSVDQYTFEPSKDCTQWQTDLESLYC